MKGTSRSMAEKSTAVAGPLLDVQRIYCFLHIVGRRFWLMTRRNGVRWGHLASAGLMALVATAPGAVANAQAPGMPRTYSIQRVDSPQPRGGGSFGWGIASADLTGDGK